MKMATTLPLDSKLISTGFLEARLENVRHAEHFLEITEMHDKMPRVVRESVEQRLSKETLDALEWARDFMKKYERKHKWKE